VWHFFNTPFVGAVATWRGISPKRLVCCFTTWNNTAVLSEAYKVMIIPERSWVHCSRCTRDAHRQSTGQLCGTTYQRRPLLRYFGVYYYRTWTSSTSMTLGEQDAAKPRACMQLTDKREYIQLNSTQLNSRVNDPRWAVEHLPVSLLFSHSTE
jgi:hypothetical protein